METVIKTLDLSNIYLRDHVQVRGGIIDSAELGNRNSK